jgi:secreted Zn-dependent insulinase-like peptidase
MDLTEKLIVLVVGLLAITFIAVAIYNKNDTLKQLKETYEKELQGSDREKALRAGEAYYRSLRGGDLSKVDEQLILKDISTMPENDNPDPI